MRCTARGGPALTTPARDVLPLLDHLAAARPEGHEVWQGWHIRRIGDGHNGLVYRATGSAGDLAIKFSKRDARDRAGREYHALQALRQLGLDIAPEPVLLERERYEHPVVVQSWLEGTVSADPPGDAAGWEQLRRHYGAIHAVTPSAVAGPLPRAVITATRAHDALERLTREMAQMPPDAPPAGLQALVTQVQDIRWPAWPEPPSVLCRVDPNPSNFVRRPGPWASVDWENSGWGEPAFEIGDLMAFPAYAPVPAARWEWFAGALFDHDADPAAALRVRVYYLLTLVWWAARLARLWYEIENGLEEQRLVQRPPGWREGLPLQYRRSLKRAHVALQGFLEG